MITIKAEKVVIDGEPAYRILDLEAIEKNKLPQKYLEQYPHIYSSGYRNFKDITVRPARDTPSYFVYVGKISSPKQFDNFIETVNAAGANLAKINAEIRESQKKWHGTVEYKI